MTLKQLFDDCEARSPGMRRDLEGLARRAGKDDSARIPAFLVESMKGKPLHEISELVCSAIRLARNRKTSPGLDSGPGAHATD